jgi:aspartate racemase
MKKFGLIGGTSWHSTVEYYATINGLINDRHGDNTNPPLRIISLNQRQIHDLQRSDDWDAIADIFAEAALELQGVGVDGIALCANTPHKVFDQLRTAVSIPILHIADAIGATLEDVGLDTAGLIGTRFTMSQDFIKGRLADRYQVKTVVPTVSEQSEIQNLIYEKLSVGVFDECAKEFILGIIDSLSKRGARAIILGCTEFPILLKGTQCPMPLIDSLKCHCEAIARYILDEGKPEQSPAGDVPKAAPEE